jgi:hypothetical protein
MYNMTNWTHKLTPAQHTLFSQLDQFVKGLLAPGTTSANKRRSIRNKKEFHVMENYRLKYWKVLLRISIYREKQYIGIETGWDFYFFVSLWISSGLRRQYYRMVPSGNCFLWRKVFVGRFMSMEMKLIFYKTSLCEMRGFTVLCT